MATGLQESQAVLFSPQLALLAFDQEITQQVKYSTTTKRRKKIP